MYQHVYSSKVMVGRCKTLLWSLQKKTECSVKQITYLFSLKGKKWLAHMNNKKTNLHVYQGTGDDEYTRCPVLLLQGAGDHE